MSIWRIAFQAEELKCKGPEAAACLSCLRHRGEPSVVGGAVTGEVREITRSQDKMSL